jgi:hypothetical protein
MSRYNESLAASRTARSRANRRNPWDFWLDAPVYTYTLPCGHEFRSRTPATDATRMWCAVCGEFARVDPETMPVDHHDDECISRAQDAGVIRERVARAVSANGLPETDLEIADLADQFHLTPRDVRTIVAGLTPRADQLATCKSGRHEMTGHNVMLHGGKRRCRACWTIARKAGRARLVLPAVLR